MMIRKVPPYSTARVACQRSVPAVRSSTDSGEVIIEG
jgi:hypothetical protein